MELQGVELEDARKIFKTALATRPTVKEQPISRY
jgi:hypothetical protein